MDLYYKKEWGGQCVFFFSAIMDYFCFIVEVEFHVNQASTNKI